MLEYRKASGNIFCRNRLHCSLLMPVNRAVKRGAKGIQAFFNWALNYKGQGIVKL